MKKIKVALLGCGDRGCIYADYSLRNPDDMEIVAVVDNVPLKKENGYLVFNCPEHPIYGRIPNIKIDTLTRLDRFPKKIKALIK